MDQFSIVDAGQFTTVANNENSSNKSNSEKAEAHGSFFNNMLSASAEISASSASSKKSAQAQSTQTALAISQSENGQTLNKSSRESNTKNIHNRVKKVATETSSNNKVEVTSSSSEQYEENTSNKEIMTLANPNEGRAINYNLYQLQNVYESCINLKDMKIVVNSGIELAEESGILDTRVYELEDFNKIFRNTTRSPSEILMCAFIARKILKNYTDLKNQDNIDNGILKIKLKSGQNMALVCAELKQIIKDLNLFLVSKNSIPPNKDASPESPDTNLKIKLAELQKTLLSLQNFTFIFTPHHLLSKSQHVVNAPAYHMDTQIGRLAATEPYLENLRELTCKTKEANVDLIHAEADYWRNLKSLKDTTNAVNSAPSSALFTPLRGSPVNPNKTRVDQLSQLSTTKDDTQRTELKR